MVMSRVQHATRYKISGNPETPRRQGDANEDCTL